ncbi:MAG: hypothetical protein ABIK26_00395 [Candidatus Omnitrophota bacterium]
MEKIKNYKEKIKMEVKMKAGKLEKVGYKEYLKNEEKTCHDV